MLKEALPQGSYRRKGHGWNGNSSRVEVAVSTRDLNRPEKLDKIFFGENNTSTLQRFTVADGSEIRAHDASGPYTGHHLMLIMRGPNFPNNQDGTSVKDGEPRTTEQFYKFSPEAQKAYWEVLLGSLSGMQRELKKTEPDADYRVFSGGNWMTTFSNFEERNSKTVGLVHDHICAVKEGDIKAYMKDCGLESIEGYLEEKAFTERVLPTALPRIQRLMPDDAPTLKPREQLPYGYGFVVPADTSLEKFTQIMADQHEAYANVGKYVKELFGKRGQQTEINQPAYNLYIELDDLGNRHVSISPTFMGPIGVMEAAGIQSKRDPEYRNIVSIEDAMNVKKAVVKDVREKVTSSVPEYVMAA